MAGHPGADEPISHQRFEDAVALFSRLEDIVEFLPDATFVIDADNRIVAWNRASTRAPPRSRPATST